MGTWVLGCALSDGGGWHQEAEESMTDNEANVRGTTSFAFGTSNTRADKTEIFGRVQSMERFHEMMRALYNELGRPLSEGRCSES